MKSFEFKLCCRFSTLRRILDSPFESLSEFKILDWLNDLIWPRDLWLTVALRFKIKNHDSESGRFGTFQVRIKDFFICSWRSHLFAFTWSDRSTGQMTFSQTRLSTKKKYKIYSFRDHNLISRKFSSKMDGHETSGP